MGTVKKTIHLALLISLAWTGCVKDPQDIPPGLTNDPVFGLRASLGGQSLSIDAGKGGWTMQPVVVDEDSTIVYTTIFSLGECLQQCAPSLKFRFYRADPVSGAAEIDFFTTIQAGPKDFVLSKQQRDSFEIRLNTDPGLFMSGYSHWQNLADPNTSQAAEYKDVIGYGEVLNVCLQSLAYTGCQYNQCLYFNPATIIPCITSIQPRLEDPRTISLLLKPENGTPPFKIEWFDGSSSSSIVLPLQDSTVDLYIGVKVTDALGNKSELNQTIRVQNGNVDACYFPVTLVSTPVPYAAAALSADRVEVIYIDEQGVEWSSTSGIQPGDSFMTISDVQYFGASPMNQPTYKTTLNMTVTLFNPSGDSKKLQSQDATIALSHR